MRASRARVFSKPRYDRIEPNGILYLRIIYEYLQKCMKMKLNLLVDGIFL